MSLISILKPRRFFDISTNKGLAKLSIANTLVVILVWNYPLFMNYESAQKIWWQVFALLLTSISLYIAIYGFILIYTKKYHPIIFKKIVTKEYLEFTEQTIDDENKVVDPSVVNTRPGEQELKVERKNE